MDVYLYSTIKYPYCELGLQDLVTKLANDSAELTLGDDVAVEIIGGIGEVLIEF